MNKKKKKKFGSITFTKKMFIETINDIQKQYEHDSKCGDAFSVILPEDFITSYDNHYIFNSLLEIIKIAFNDNHEDSWIDYYIYELDFGKKFKMGMVTDKNNNDCDLSNAETLYKFLKENFKEK